MASTIKAVQFKRTTLALLSITLSVMSASCTLGLPGFHQKKARVFVPPPVDATPVPRSKPPTLPPPDGGAVADASVELPDAAVSLPQLGGPPVPPPKRPVAAAPKTAPQTTPAVPEPAPAAPKLGQIYTAAQAREYNRTIDDSLERVRKVLATVATKNLTAQQTQIAESIRTFQRQAESAREQDLVTAVSLARRADLLARDLMERLP
jgi:hypothetical protein